MRTVGPLKFKAQILCGASPAMGPGKADLLEAIDQGGSITAGARSMGMSYRQAWSLVDEMNRHFQDLLIETSTGGAHNGARVTDAGRAVLKAFREIEASMARAAEGEALETLAAMVRPTPHLAGKPAKSNSGS